MVKSNLRAPVYNYTLAYTLLSILQHVLRGSSKPRYPTAVVWLVLLIARAEVKEMPSALVCLRIYETKTDHRTHAQVN
jgi:hypothetical protein